MVTALKLDHARVIDTAFIYKYENQPINRRPSLNNLCKASSLNFLIIASSWKRECVIISVFFPIIFMLFLPVRSIYLLLQVWSLSLTKCLLSTWVLFKKDLQESTYEMFLANVLFIPGCLGWCLYNTYEQYHMFCCWLLFHLDPVFFDCKILHLMLIHLNEKTSNYVNCSMYCFDSFHPKAENFFS